MTNECAGGELLNFPLPSVLFSCRVAGSRFYWLFTIATRVHSLPKRDRQPTRWGFTVQTPLVTVGACCAGKQIRS